MDTESRRYAHFPCVYRRDYIAVCLMWAIWNGAQYDLIYIGIFLKFNLSYWKKGLTFLLNTVKKMPSPLLNFRNKDDFRVFNHAGLTVSLDGIYERGYSSHALCLNAVLKRSDKMQCHQGWRLPAPPDQAGRRGVAPGLPPGKHALCDNAIVLLCFAQAQVAARVTYAKPVGE